MSISRNNRPLVFPVKLLQSLGQVRSPRKYLLLGSSGALLILTGLLALRIIQRNFYGGRLVLAAGNETGESYIFSKAFAKVVEAHSSIRIDVCATDGADDNIRALENRPLVDKAACFPAQPTKQLEADLITAQADRLYYSLIS